MGGIILKQTFVFWGTPEVRLVIDGVPKQLAKYNAWELWENMAVHHEHFRGLVYDSSLRVDKAPYLDFCFDCTVLWETISTYATQNHMDPYELLTTIFKYNAYTPSNDKWTGTALAWIGKTTLGKHPQRCIDGQTRTIC